MESRHECRRPVQKYEQLSTYGLLCTRAIALYRAGMSSTQIAERLNSEGFHTPNGADRFSGAMVYTFLVRQGLFGQGTPRQWNRDTLRRNEWSLNNLARELGMPVDTLRAWHRRGWVIGRKSAGVNGAWNLWADKRELNRLRRLRAWKRGGYNLEYRPADLVTSHREANGPKQDEASEPRTSLRPQGAGNTNGRAGRLVR